MSSSNKSKNLVVIGAGAWGSALAINFAKLFNKVYIICHNQEQTIQKKHLNLNIDYPDNITLTIDFNCISDSDNILIATPSYAFLDILKQIKLYISNQHIAWATKGFFGKKLLHQAFIEEFPNLQPCLISGPSFAIEVASFKPTALVVTSPDEEVAKIWAECINSDSIKAYISTDIIGCEIGGAVKNILAIAAGISSGLGFGANTMSALITRGLAEMMRFGAFFGAKEKTFAGLTGLGDLTLTCLDDKSRNRTFGKLLAKYNNTEQALSEVGATVEGLNALPVVLNLASKHNIKMPICFAVAGVVADNIAPQEAVATLMQGGGYYE